MKFFGVIGSDNRALAESIREQLVHAGLTCESRHVVTLEQLVDCASLDHPAVIVVDQPAGLGETQRLLRELALVSGAHVIALGPADDPKRIIAVMQAGAHEYVDANLWQSMLVESLVRLRTRQETKRFTASQPAGRTIGILAASGGIGGSTVSANVAAVLASKQGSALLVDLRFESGDLAAMLDLHPSFSLADLSTNLERLDDSLFEQILTPHASGIQLLAAPQDFDSIERITLKGFRRALAMGVRKFPYVVFDLGGIYSPIHREASLRCDALVILVRLDYPSIRNAQRTLAQLVGLGVERSRIRLVVNRYGESKQLSVGQAQEALGCKLEVLLPDEPASINWALNNGQTVVTAKPRAKVSKRLTELAISLNGSHP